MLWLGAGRASGRKTIRALQTRAFNYRPDAIYESYLVDLRNKVKSDIGILFDELPTKNDLLLERVTS